MGWMVYLRQLGTLEHLAVLIMKTASGDSSGIIDRSILRLVIRARSIPDTCHFEARKLYPKKSVKQHKRLFLFLKVCSMYICRMAYLVSG